MHDHPKRRPRARRPGARPGEPDAEAVSVYVDTSALAKWYVNETGSEEVEAFLREACPVYISLLTKVEMTSLMGRRTRDGQLVPETQARVLATFEGDIIAGHLVILPLSSETFLIAESLLGAHPEIPLVTLAAFHLGVMHAAGIDVLATADEIMARAAEASGTGCRSFF